jgi:hypothetical protein
MLLVGVPISVTPNALVTFKISTLLPPKIPRLSDNCRPCHFPCLQIAAVSGYYIFLAQYQASIRVSSCVHHILMASVYQSAYPDDTTFDLAIKDFLEKFYAISDNPDVTAEAYAENFTDSATLVMGKNRAVGRSGTLFRVHSSLHQR